MSKESQLALDCPGCTQKIAHPQYHIRHCDNTRGFDWDKAKKTKKR